MIRICGEKVSSRLSRRLQMEPASTYSFEKRSLFSKWMDRAQKRIQKIIFCLSSRSIPSVVLLPPFPKKESAEFLDQVSAVRENYENVILWIGAVFSLFVSIFYQSSEEPASSVHVCGDLRGERREAYASLLSSLLFLGLYQEVVDYLQYRIFVMENSYV